jgi:hypothetical protein
MRIVYVDEEHKKVGLVMGRRHMRKPLYCPVCDARGKREYLFDILVLEGRIKLLCSGCNNLLDIKFTKLEY